MGLESVSDDVRPVQLVLQSWPAGAGPGPRLHSEAE